MRPPRMMAWAALCTGALLSAACNGPGFVIRPVIYATDEQAATAMRSAPLILLVRIQDTTFTGNVRQVEKPPEVGGPMVPRIPLHLARIRAEVLLTVHGQERTTVEFYSWIWASGKHGGSRLFNPLPGGIRAVFLREAGGFLHTVGDYPSYDLELRSEWVPAMLSDWKSGRMRDADPVDRLVALRLRAEFEGLTEQRLREDLGENWPRVDHYWTLDLNDLVRLTGPLFVVTQLDDMCLHAGNPAVRFAACYSTTEYFPGRCEAYRHAGSAALDGFGAAVLAGMFQSCHVAESHHVADLRSGAELRWGFYGASLTPQHRRETLRVYAAAMDKDVHIAACEVAAAAWGLRDLPECTGPRAPLPQPRRLHQIPESATLDP